MFFHFSETPAAKAQREGEGEGEGAKGKESAYQGEGCSRCCTGTWPAKTKEERIVM
jgi:hypothetical protein